MTQKTPISLHTGQSFRDRDGQRWWIKGPRPGQSDQLVVEAEMKGSYPRVGIYAMTQAEFREHVRTAGLKPDRSRHHERH